MTPSKAVVAKETQSNSIEFATKLALIFPFLLMKPKPLKGLVAKLIIGDMENAC